MSEERDLLLTDEEIDVACAGLTPWGSGEPPHQRAIGKAQIAKCCAHYEAEIVRKDMLLVRNREVFNWYNEREAIEQIEAIDEEFTSSVKHLIATMSGQLSTPTMFNNKPLTGKKTN